ncbi:hypothetical protein I6F35_22955 [Bradyrhizobium sp. BRP22]|uniref:hypothetical protein n=1 Tax=Bradyrhizobium sp. BRP22 TaxID=2793821 RepID=UPI001CD3DB11|nr:hypothetical protein [Bradyrhizobium sp. BRP22]MCA1456030.1 hypothetical protein [Bradyrhizobium sp. BRP22]
MLVTRYFLYVGGALLALLYAVDALVPQDAATASHSAPGIDKTTVRIHSAQKLPERVVFDTTLPTIVPPVTQMAAAPLPPAPAAEETSDQARARETFAQYVPTDTKKHEPQAPKKHKVARARAYQPQPMYAGQQPMYAGQQPMYMGQRPMRVAQQSRFGFFGGGPFWNSTW